jgi:hypothetical protein
MKKIYDTMPIYLKDMVVDYITLDKYKGENNWSFSHSTKTYIEYSTHYNLLYDAKNKSLKLNLTYDGSMSTLLPIILSRS